VSTYAVGDIHGCHATLERLLARLRFDESNDSLWLVGDLVNRGPRSLETLRWARRVSVRLGERFETVLGNHDLHLVAVYRGWTEARKKDVFQDILAAADGPELIEWLAERPLFHRRGKTLLVHAGLLPEWTALDAERWARRLEGELSRSEQARRLLARAGQGADVSDPGWRALAALTRLRALTENGEFCDFSGPPDELPRGCIPWFVRRDRRTRDDTVVCGHWAAMGLRLEEGLLALDSGAAWGGPLTAVRLEDRKIFQERNRDQDAVF
jgi:bis(5'-nucleosyl)-tetraphosphatase (symmetrical)